MSNSNDPFVNYYADAALKPETLDRFAATKRAVMAAARHFGLQGSRWRVADIGCGAATQCALWARDGHTVFGVDINAALVELGRQRMAAEKLDVSLSIGSATQLPWPDASMDVCLCPELLEHVADWQPVIREAVRVLKPGGVLYLSTTNLLCPVQEEFTLPAYSWYPAPLKRHYEKLAVTTRPELVNHARYPAVNWFTARGLRGYLGSLGLESMDNFDVAALGAQGAARRVALAVIRAFPPARFLAHVMTPYTIVFASRAA
jgi:2-polyprenyl-6-hydroxyphenyl methylase/3-demethylubiquinone-9 3-methyltransferase